MSFCPSSKLAALGIAEALHSELQLANPASPGHVHVVALCPGIVNTNLRASSSELHHNLAMDEREGDQSAQITSRMFDAQWDQAMTPAFCADKCFDHLEEGKFYCILNQGSEDHPSIEHILTTRYNGMISRRRKVGAFFVKSKV